MPVVIHKDGKSYQSSTKRMFGTQGPWLLSHYRLDQLVSATVIQDSSTVTSHGTSHGTTTTGLGGQVARGIAGGVVAGPVGALIGAGGASKRTKTTTTTQEILSLNVFMRLEFRGESPVSVQVLDEETFKLIMASVGQPEWSEEKLEGARASAKRAATAAAIETSRETKRQNAIGPKATRYGLITAAVVFAAIIGYVLWDSGGFVIGVVFGIIPSCLIGYLAYQVTMAMGGDGED